MVAMGAILIAAPTAQFEFWQPRLGEGEAMTGYDFAPLERTMRAALAAFVLIASTSAPTLAQPLRQDGMDRRAGPNQAAQMHDARQAAELAWRGEHDHDPRALLEAARIMGRNHAYLTVKPHGSWPAPGRLDRQHLLRMARDFAGGDRRIGAQIETEMRARYPKVADIICMCFYNHICDAQGHCVDNDYCWCEDV